MIQRFWEEAIKTFGMEIPELVFGNSCVGHDPRRLCVEELSVLLSNLPGGFYSVDNRHIDVHND